MLSSDGSVKMAEVAERDGEGRVVGLKLANQSGKRRVTVERS